MYGWSKKKSEPPPFDEKIAHQQPGDLFPWSKGWHLTTLDEAIIAVPAAILGGSGPIGSVIRGDDRQRRNIPTAPPGPTDHDLAPTRRIRLAVQVLPGDCGPAVRERHRGPKGPGHRVATETSSVA